MPNDATVFSPDPAKTLSHQEEPFRLLFNQKQSAHALGISLRTLQNLISSRQIMTRRIGRRVLIHRKDLEVFARRDHPCVGGE